MLCSESVAVLCSACGNITTGRLAAAGESQLVRHPDGHSSAWLLKIPKKMSRTLWYQTLANIITLLLFLQSMKRSRPKKTLSDVIMLTVFWRPRWLYVWIQPWEVNSTKQFLLPSREQRTILNCVNPSCFTEWRNLVIHAGDSLSVAKDQDIQYSCHNHHNRWLRKKNQSSVKCFNWYAKETALILRQEMCSFTKSV